jgi:urease accessory protein
MKSKTLTFVAATTALLLAGGVAQAHPGHAGHGGLYPGFAHPFSGLDHVLAMIAVGILSAQIGGRAIWILPITFIGLMIGGAALNFAHVPVPFVEQGIAASVLVLGLLIASSLKMHASYCAAIIGLFAAFHGYAHAAEMTSGAAAANYALGFVSATAALHAVGIGIGIAGQRIASSGLVRLGGAAIAACGLMLILA